MSKKSNLRADLRLILMLCQRLGVSPYSIGRYAELRDADGERSRDDPKTSLKNYVEGIYEGYLDYPREEIVYESEQVLGLLRMLKGKL